MKDTNGSYCIYTICDVWYVPDIQKNLLSIGRTSERDIRVIFEEGGKGVIFCKENKTLAEGYKENSPLYKLNILPVNKNFEANVVLSNSLIDWHEKLGHVNYQTLNKYDIEFMRR